MRFAERYAPIADQVLTGAVNAGVTAILARAIAPAQFAVFTSAFSAYVLLLVLHNSFVTEPLLVRHSGLTGPEGHALHRVAARFHRAFCVVLLVVSAAIGWWHGRSLAAVPYGLASGLWAVSLTEVLFERRVRYSRVDRLGALRVSTVFAVGSFLGFALLAFASALTVAAMALVSAVAATLSIRRPVLALSRVDAGAPGIGLVGEGSMRLLSRHSFRAAVSGFLFWVPLNVQYWVLGAVSADALAIGGVRVAFTVVTPWHTVTLALAMASVPLMVAEYRGREHWMLPQLKHLFVVVGGGGVVAAAALLAVGRPLVVAAFGTGYPLDASAVGALASVVAVIGLANVMVAALRAAERSRELLVGAAVCAIVATTCVIAAAEFSTPAPFLLASTAGYVAFCAYALFTLAGRPQQ